MSGEVSTEALEAVTKRVLDLLTSQGLLFTALDVSNAVKQTFDTVRHRQVSPLVRALFDEGVLGDSYTRTLIDVMAGGTRKGKPAQAYLYHLTTRSTDEYDDAQRSQLAIPPVTASAEDDSEVDPDTTELNLTLDADLRLRIPRQFVENAGIDSEHVRVDHVAGGPDLLLRAVAADADLAGALGRIRFMHPALLHVATRFLPGVDPGASVRVVATGDDTLELRLA